MPRTPKDHQPRETEDDESDLHEAPHIDESDLEEERSQAGLYEKADKHAEHEVDDDDIAEEIDLDDVNAMEDPDA